MAGVSCLIHSALPPRFQQLEDCRLHALWCIGRWKIPRNSTHGQRKVPTIRFFLFQHDRQYRVIGQQALPGQFLHPLGLGQGRSGLFTLNGDEKQTLFLFRKEGELCCRRQCDPVFIHHLQKLRDQFIQPKIPLYLAGAVRLFSTMISRDVFPANFCPTWSEVKSDRLPCRLMASSFILYAFARSLGKITSL